MCEDILILEARQKNVCSTDIGEIPRLIDLLKKFKLTDGYRVDYTNVPVWTWNNSDRSFSTYIDR